jgi:hypothetical protein
MGIDYVFFRLVIFVNIAMQGEEKESFFIIVVALQSQVGQNGAVYDPTTDRQCCQNGDFTTVYRVNTGRFQSVFIGMIGRRNTYCILSVS